MSRGHYYRIETPARRAAATAVIGPVRAPAGTVRRVTSQPVEIVPTVETELASFLASRSDVVDPVGPVYRAAADALSRFVLGGGKRIRPSFAWLGWLGARGAAEREKSVLTACSALELVQACALIHDDIIDSSSTRRGAPTIHLDQARLHRERGWDGSSEHYGISVAILLGDLALAWADDMFLAAGLTADELERAAPTWAAMRTEVLGGQLLDITAEAADDGTIDTAMRINRYKTACYTVQRPLDLGAAIAGASDAVLAGYRSFGADIGIAFQLRDDLLGVYGDPGVTGKPSGDDLREGKRTVLMAAARMAAAGRADGSTERLRALIGVPLSPDQLADARQLLIDLGAVAEVERRIDDLTERALAALDALDIEPVAAERLRALALAATRRDF